MANKLPSGLEQALKEKFPGWTIESLSMIQPKKQFLLLLSRKGRNLSVW
jgi:hypothetical protein